jgi:hypothetical protein
MPWTVGTHGETKLSINDIGKEGERIARHILKDTFKVDGLMQADWLCKKDGTWYCVEVKHKEPFQPPPFKGHGLESYQADMRMKLQSETGIRCLFLVIDMDSTIYWQWLDELEKTEHFTTRNGVRIYNIQYFKTAGKWTA